MQTDILIPNFRRMETLHFQEHDRSHLCPARDPTSVQYALPTLKRIQAITARWKSNSPSSKTVEASLCISPHALPPPSSKLEASRFESPDEPPRHTGWAPPQSRECLLSQQALSTEFVQSSYRVRTEFVGLKSVSDRSLGTLVFIGAAALWVPRSQRDVSLHVWQLGQLSAPTPHTTTCHIRRRLVGGTHSGEPETDPHSVVRQRGISKPARRVEAH
jgi:hypothetical protein